MNHNEWLEARKHSIGASDIAVVLGLSRYKSAYTLWAEKCGLVAPVNETIPMRVGHALEHLIAELYTEETGRNLHDFGDYDLRCHPQYPFLSCTLDRVVIDYQRIVERVVELKAMGERAAADLADDARLEHQCQLQQQMAITGAAIGDIAVLVGNRELRVFEYARNDAFINTVLIPKAVHFWAHVQNQTPPEVDESLSTLDTLKRLHPNDNGDIVPVDALAVEEFMRLGAQIKDLESERQLFENRIRAGIGDATFGEADGYKVSLKTQGRGGKISAPFLTTEERTEIEAILRGHGFKAKVTEASKYRVMRVREMENE